jgi:hypothetical protein
MFELMQERRYVRFAFQTRPAMKNFARSASGFSAVVSPGLEEDLLALHCRTQVGCGVQPKRLA